MHLHTQMPVLPIQDAEPQFIMPEGASQRRGRFELAFSQIGGSVCVGKLNSNCSVPSVKIDDF